MTIKDQLRQAQAWSGASANCRAEKIGREKSIARLITRMSIAINYDCLINVIVECVLM